MKTRQPIVVPIVVYNRLTIVKGELETANRAAGVAKPEVTYGQAIEVLLNHYAATSQLVKDALS